MTNFLNFKMKNQLMEKSVILILLFSALSFQAAAQGLVLDGGFTGDVMDAAPQNYTSAVQPDGKILVGGFYDFVNGVAINGITRLNADGTRDTSFNAGGSGLPIGGNVLSIFVQSDGKILIGGSFGSYNGTTVGNLARLNADGTLDTSFNPGGSGVSGGRITWIERQTDGKFVVVGQGNTSYNGNTSNGVFRINANGTFDSSFVSGFSAPPSLEQVIIQPDGKLLLGGFIFNVTYSGNPVKAIVRVNTDGSFDNTFTNNFTTDSSVVGMDIQPDGKIVVGGNLTVGDSDNVIARLNTNGSTDNTFTPSTLPIGGYDSIKVQPDGKILAAGIVNISGTNYALVRYNSNGSLDNSILNAADEYGYHVTLQADGKILLSGLFTNFAVGGLRRGLARFNQNGAIDTGFAPSFSRFATVTTIARQTDGKILVAGDFTTAGGNLNRQLARFNADGTLDNTFSVGSGPGKGGYNFILIQSVAVQADGKILVGGYFGSFNGTPRQLIVRLNVNGSIDTSFNLSGNISPSNFQGVDEVFVLPDGKILIGGRLQNQSFQNRCLMRLNADGSIDTTFNSGTSANGLVYKILRQPDGKILIGGAFGSYNGTARQRAARINADGTLDTTFVGAGAINGQINDMALQPDGKIIIGGSFTMLGDNPQNRVARLNADGTFDSSFNAGTGANNVVNSVLIKPNGKILVGGVFTNIGGTNINRLARLNANGSLDTGFVSGFGATFPTVNSLLLQPDGKLFVGGLFTGWNGAPRRSILRLTPPRTPFDFDGDGKTDIGIFRPSVGEWWINRSSNNSTFALQFGNSTDKIVPADYTGDGKTDIAVFRNGQWFILRSEDSSFFAFPFGANGDMLVPADYDGDGKADAAVFRESDLTWYIQKSSGGTDIIGFGAVGDKPVVADYDGDGKADIAIFRPNGANGAEWWIRRSSNGSVFATQFGTSTDKAVPGDFTGDGKTDIALWRPANGNWFVLRSEDLSFFAFPFGANGDLPVPGDYDGDGKFDAGIFRPTNSTWYIQRSTAGTLIQQFGASGDLPIPNAFVP